MDRHFEHQNASHHRKGLFENLQCTVERLNVCPVQNSKGFSWTPSTTHSNYQTTTSPTNSKLHLPNSSWRTGRR
jgi:hypothetical protein